ncbi:MAG: helix-turn-helix domain-containing protein [Bacteroidota bacterium]
MKKVYGGDIRKFRDEKCYTQAYMADQLGVGQSTYQKIEAGTIKISAERLTQIAGVLNKPINAFLQKEYQASEPTPSFTIDISKAEYDLMQKIILQQEKRIEELEAKIIRKDLNIEELKNSLY